MNDSPRLVGIRLTAFKSFVGETLPLGAITLLTGRNSAGKSNALDAIAVLSRLAGGENLANALDAPGAAEPPVRGGSAGCPPHGSTDFALGCSVRLGSIDYHWDIDIAVDDHLRVRRESLTSTGRQRSVTLFETDPDDRGPSIQVKVHNGSRGRNPMSSLWRDRSVLTQVTSVLKGLKSHGEVRHGVDAVRAALAGAYHLDPVPSAMRGFVPRRDFLLRRRADNLSASLVDLASSQPRDFETLVELARRLVDDRVLGITSASTQLDDVMIELVERQGPSDRSIEHRTPAREMSDGLLRVLAIGAALLSDRGRLDLAGAPSPDEAPGAPLLIVEEIENGLHPSQAGRVLDLLREAGRERGKSVLVTTHSPALLDAAEGDLNDDIFVCYRDDASGLSRLTALPELEGYPRAMATGTIGDNVTRGRLTAPERRTIGPVDVDDFFGVAR